MDTCEIVCFDLKWAVNGPLIYGEPSVNATMGTDGGNVCQIRVCILPSDIRKMNTKPCGMSRSLRDLYVHYKTFIFV